MKFISLQDNLKNTLAIVSHVVGKNINLPILSNILFRVSKNQIELSATNLEIGITHRMRGKIDSEGDFTVDSRVITEYINLLPSGSKVEIEQGGEDIKIVCDNYKTKIKTQPAQDFPLLPQVEREKYYAVNADDLKKALSSVIFSVSNNETRLELSGVLFCLKENEIILVGTDSYRLAEKKIKAQSNYDAGNAKIIVPARTLQELIRILSTGKSEDQIDSDNDAKIYLSENQVLFSWDATELVSRLIIGNYPDYQQIIPQNFQTGAIINKEELSRAVKAAAIFAKSGINDVGLELKAKEGKIVVSSTSTQIGESETSLDAEISGADNDIIINYRYLIDGLNNIDASKVKIEVINNQTPCILKPETDSQYLYIIMPIRQ